MKSLVPALRIAPLDPPIRPDTMYVLLQLYYGDKRRSAADGVRSRLLFPQSQADILSLIGDSVDNWRTKQYDWYQERTNNIL
jgi:hypothetical protein